MQKQICIRVGIYPKIGISNDVLDDFEGHPFELLLDEDTRILLKPILPLTEEAVYYYEKNEFEVLKENTISTQKLLLPKLKKAKNDWDKDFLFEGKYYEDDQKKYAIAFRCMQHIQVMIDYALEKEVYILIEYTK